MKFHGPYALQIDAEGKPALCSIGDPLINAPENRSSRCVAAYIVEQEEGEPSIETELKRLRMIERDGICRMTKLDINAEVGKPFEASATFQGEGVQMFAAHMVEWFRENGGDNFVTVDLSDKDGTRFSLTMQRQAGKSPAQVLSELRRELAEVRGEHEQPIEELCKKLPHLNFRPTLRAEIMAESLAQLQRRVLIQCDWLGSYSSCLDDQEISLRIPGSGVQAARDPRNIRAIVEHMRKLLMDIYQADRFATIELDRLGMAGIESKFKHQIEDALGLPSTRPKL